MSEYDNETIIHLLMSPFSPCIYFNPPLDSINCATENSHYFKLNYSFLLFLMTNFHPFLGVTEKRPPVEGQMGVRKLVSEYGRLKRKTR